MVFEGKAWSVFNKISLETPPSCVKLWIFGVFYQNFRKYKAKSSLAGEFCRILANDTSTIPLKMAVLLKKLSFGEILLKAHTNCKLV